MVAIDVDPLDTEESVIEYGEKHGLSFPLAYGGDNESQVIRTFILVNISWYLDRAGSTHQALIMMRDSITKFRIGVDIIDASSTWAGSTYAPLIAALFGCLVVLIHSILRERKIDTRSLLMKKPVVIRCLVLFLLLMSLVVIGNKPLSQGGFIYANF